MAQQKEWLERLRPADSGEHKAGQTVRWPKRPKVSYWEAQKLPDTDG